MNPDSDDPVGGPEAFIWRLRGARPPSLTRVLPFARVARAGLMAACGRLGLLRLPDWLHHAGEHGDSAYWLPFDFEGDGLIRHFVCLRPGGLGLAVLPAFASDVEAYLGEDEVAGEPSGRWRLEPESMGPLAPGPFVGHARLWRTITPYVCDKEHDRGKDKPRRGRSLLEQVDEDLAKRGLAAFGRKAEPERLLVNGASLSASAFAVKTDKMRPPPRAQSAFLTLAFAEPVSGPLAIGFGAHYGLGGMTPVG